MVFGSCWTGAGEEERGRMVFQPQPLRVPAFVPRDGPPLAAEPGTRPWRPGPALRLRPGPGLFGRRLPRSRVPRQIPPLPRQVPSQIAFKIKTKPVKPS